MSQYVQYSGLESRVGYVYDDWQDNEIYKRDRSVAPRNTLSREYRLFRPVWYLQNGNPTAANQRLELPTSGGPHEISKFTDQSVGRWEFTFIFAASPTSGNINLNPYWTNSGDNYWRIQVLNNGGVRLQKDDSGSVTNVITGSISDLTIEHTVAATRDENDQWELFIDGASQGTATDSFMPDTNTLQLDGANLDAEARIRELKLY